MKYNEVKTAFFDPATAENAVPTAVTQGGQSRQLRDAFEPVSMHAVWSPLVHERMEARGLDFFGTYVLGRACVMGEPSGAVVASAFAAFEPSMISGIYDQARQVLGQPAGRCCGSARCNRTTALCWSRRARQARRSLWDAFPIEPGTA